MSEHKNTAIHIGQLNLRVPGSNAEMSHCVTDSVGRSLAQRVSAGIQGHLGALNVRVQVPADSSEAEMSDAITGVIRNALQRGYRQ